MAMRDRDVTATSVTATVDMTRLGAVAALASAAAAAVVVVVDLACNNTYTFDGALAQLTAALETDRSVVGPSRNLADKVAGATATGGDAPAGRFLGHGSCL